MMHADGMDTQSALAVMPTNPARHPFNIIERSGFLCAIQDVAIAAINPAAADRAVVVNTYATITGSAENTEAPLNPNHPNHSRNTPKVANPRLLPGIAWVLPFTYLPMRGPSKNAPTRAAQPPTECTNVEPAKS